MEEHKGNVRLNGAGEISLEDISLGVQYVVNQTILDRIGQRAVEDRMRGQCIYSLTLPLLGQRQKLIVPTDWWQHLKSRWFPQWLLCRFPTRYRIWNAMAFFPNLDPLKDAYDIRFAWMKGEITEETT